MNTTIKNPKLEVIWHPVLDLFEVRIVEPIGMSFANNKDLKASSEFYSPNEAMQLLVKLGFEFNKRFGPLTDSKPTIWRRIKIWFDQKCR